MNYTKTLKFEPYNTDRYSDSLVNILKDISEPNSEFQTKIADSVFEVNKFLFTYCAKHSFFDYALAYHDYLTICSSSNSNIHNFKRHAFVEFCAHNLEKYSIKQTDES